MADARTHYDTHLGPVYSWMAGDFAALCRRNSDLFTEIGIEPLAGARLAVDLGCGHGAQSVPLAERGFDVLAIDFCRELVDELLDRAAGLPITAIDDDLLEFPRYATTPVAAVVCMGDTLPHLSSLADVEKLVHSAAALLVEGGKLVATFRDYVSREAHGEERFIPVKADEDLILTCFLEYAPEHVTVHDLLHRKRDGRWQQSVSSYRKLRLDPHRVAAFCDAAGLMVVANSSSNGVVTLVAARS